MKNINTEQHNSYITVSEKEVKSLRDVLADRIKRIERFRDTVLTPELDKGRENNGKLLRRIEDYFDENDLPVLYEDSLVEEIEVEEKVVNRPKLFGLFNRRPKVIPAHKKVLRRNPSPYEWEEWLQKKVYQDLGQHIYIQTLYSHDYYIRNVEPQKIFYLKWFRFEDVCDGWATRVYFRYPDGYKALRDRYEASHKVETLCKKYLAEVDKLVSLGRPCIVDTLYWEELKRVSTDD